MNALFTRALRAGCLTAALAPLCARPAAAAELAAVLSSGSGPYAEAYAAFSAELGLPHEVYDLAKPARHFPEEASLTAAFGARAAALDYPQGAHLVYALTPVPLRARGWHEISMLPEPAQALAAYRGLQPGLKRLAVFWTAYPGEEYLSELRRAGEALGIQVLPSRLKSPEGFPERLRALLGKMDAFWLMPDPPLITQSSIMLLAKFSCDNAVPFYAPTQALVASGATASYAPDFAGSGTAAAKAVKAILSGARLPHTVYPEHPVLRVSDLPAEKCGWPLAHKRAPGK